MLTGSLLFGSLSLGSILAGITNIGAGVLSDIKSINVNYAKQIATLMAKIMTWILLKMSLLNPRN